MSKHALVSVSITCLWSIVLVRSAEAQGHAMPSVARAAEVRTSRPTVFEGLVLDPEGAPAEGAVDVSSAGGRAVADWHGHYKLAAALHAGGGFTTAGGVAATRIARWDGTSWSALDSEMSSGGVESMVAFDDGVGPPSLFAGGSFMTSRSGDSLLAKRGCPFAGKVRRR